MVLITFKWLLQPQSVLLHPHKSLISLYQEADLSIKLQQTSKKFIFLRSVYMPKIINKPFIPALVSFSSFYLQSQQMQMINFLGAEETEYNKICITFSKITQSLLITLGSTHCASHFWSPTKYSIILSSQKWATFLRRASPSLVVVVSECDGCLPGRERCMVLG